MQPNATHSKTTTVTTTIKPQREEERKIKGESNHLSAHHREQQACQKA